MKMTSLKEYLIALADCNPPARGAEITAEEYRAMRVKHGITAHIHLPNGEISTMQAQALFESAGRIHGIFEDDKGEFSLAHYDNRDWRYSIYLGLAGDITVPLCEEGVLLHGVVEQAFWAGPIHLGLGQPIRLLQIREGGDVLSASRIHFEDDTEGWMIDPD